MTTNVDALVRSFARFLNAAWNEVQAASKNSPYEDFVPNWLQASWEMLVESALSPGVYLEVYGEGADCNGRSSRAFRPEFLPTNAIVCHPRAGAEVRDALSGEATQFPPNGLPLDELVSLTGTWYERRPPFDHALVLDSEQHDMVFALNELSLELGPAR